VALSNKIAIAGTTLALVMTAGALYYQYGLPLPESALLALTTSPAPSANVSFAFKPHATPRPVKDFKFIDGDLKAASLADFRGKVVLLNIWATWCGPCRKEMPTLDRLQATLGGPDFEVVALSIDEAGVPIVKEFYQELGLKALRIFVDPAMQAPIHLKVLGIPATLLIDREGREIARYAGPAEWDSPEVLVAIRPHLGSPSLVREGAEGSGRDKRP
jgi:thiol-disulfide isomerase/thioredoxin